MYLGRQRKYKYFWGNSILNELLVQAFRFIGFSGVGWLIDLCVYIGIAFLSKDVVINNIISSWCGITFVFIFATQRIFKVNNKMPLKYKYLIYIGYQLILIYLISKLLGIVNQSILNSVTYGLIIELSAIISKITVTPITMFMNFIVMKNIIEKL